MSCMVLVGDKYSGLDQSPTLFFTLKSTRRTSSLVPSLLSYASAWGNILTTVHVYLSSIHALESSLHIFVRAADPREVGHDTSHIAGCHNVCPLRLAIGNEQVTRGRTRRHCTGVVHIRCGNELVASRSDALPTTWARGSFKELE